MNNKPTPFHIWGDEDFDWEALDAACWYLYKNCKRWSRLGVHTKEKYGTMRVDCYFFVAYEPIQELVYPGYAYSQLPKWFRSYIDFPLGKAVQFLRLDRPVRWWQRKVIKYFWLRAAKKWSHIKDEILDEYDWIMEE